MKTTFLTLVLLVFGFSSFAFMPSFPAESSSKSEKNLAVTSEKPKSDSENKTEAKTETKTVSAKELTQKMEANYAANKKEMSFKERIANKLLIKQLKKAEKKEVKDTKIDSGLATILKVVGIIFIVVGVIGIVASLGGGFGYGLGLILVGILFYLLPSLL